MQEKEYLDQAGQLLMKFGRVFGAFEKMQVNKFNLTVPQSYTIMTLYYNRQLSMNELAGRLKVAQTTMTRVVDILVRDEYIKRIRVEDDRRVVEVALTEKGLETARMLEQLYYDSSAAICARISRDKWDQVLDSLLLMLEAMEVEY